jgi:arginyl-tRNA--protein-N-Asp/Glu arginylyltransferase
MASTAVLSAKVAVVDSGEVGTSAVYSRYNNGPRTLPLGTPALTWENSVYSRTNVSYIKF